MSIVLREYQTSIIAEVREKIRSGARSVCVSLPTGGGKTLLTAFMLKSAAAKGNPCWFTVHRRELIKQSMEAFNDVGVPYGVIAAGFLADRKQQIQLCSIQTLMRRYQRVAPPKLIVVDECHHIGARTWAELIAHFKNSFIIGLSATPSRTDGVGLGDFFQTMISGPTTAELIDMGFLSKYRYFAPTNPNLSKMHTLAGDYKKNELGAAMDKPKLVGDAVSHYLKVTPGRRALVFCVSIEHSKHMAAAFTAAGVPAEQVDGSTDVWARDNTIARFRNGTTRVLCNCELFTEGFDIPFVEAVILLRPTQSVGLYLQMVGRGLRPSPGKDETFFLDHSGNVHRHGLPDDPREWSLLGTAKAKGARDPDDVKVKQCPMCYATVAAYKPSCRHCGHVFVPVGREIETVAGELSEVDIQQQLQRKRQEQWGAQTEEELVRIGELRRYARPRAWARHIIMARHSKRRIAA